MSVIRAKSGGTALILHPEFSGRFFIFVGDFTFSLAQAFALRSLAVARS